MTRPTASGLRRLITGGIVGTGAVTLFVGMLFWTKLRVVRDIPRSAYAVPDEDGDTGDGPAHDRPDESADEPIDSDHPTD